MKNLLNKLAVILDRLKPTERALVGVAVIALLLVLWDTLLNSPFNTRITKAKSDISKSENEVLELNAQLEATKKLQEFDPNAKNRALKAKLAFELAKLNEELNQLTVGLIEPNMMTKVLEALLVRNTDLKLIKLQNIPGVPLISTTRTSSEGEVYQHGVVVEFEGQYLSTMRYLKAIEQLPWRLYWGGLEYKVMEYPVAHVTLTLYTLSLNEGWVGV